MGRGLVKLNLGCGPNGIEGWINYDWGVLPLLSKMRWLRNLLLRISWLPESYNVDWPRLELVDLRKGLPRVDASVDFIYCSHVLEHLEEWEAVELLRECRRVLRPGGVLRLVVPDLLKMVKNYYGADEFCREFYGFDKDRRTWRRRFIRGHEWMYDKNSLGRRLRDTGFVKVREVAWQKGLVPDLESLDLSIHKSLSLYYESVA